VDEDALFAALRDKVIHGAAIDVWYRCVLAPAHHNLLCTTPHVAATPMLIMFIHGHGLLDSAVRGLRGLLCFILFCWFSALGQAPTSVSGPSVTNSFLHLGGCDLC
jgi:hypothetical protein